MKRTTEILQELAELTQHEGFQRLAQSPEGDLSVIVKALNREPPKDLTLAGEDAEKYRRLMRELSDLTGASKSLTAGKTT